jgi:riboflavin synthase
MFTGIIEAKGQVTVATKNRLTYQAGFQHEPVVLGESIATNGVCLTVAAIRPTLNGLPAFEYDFDLAPETVQRTALGQLKPGMFVNLERSLRVGDRMSGHWVQGHVDGTATLIRSDSIAASCYEVELELNDSDLSRYCVKKGSISVDGISLTIHQVLDFVDQGKQRTRLIFQIIPHTWSETNLSDLSLGCKVNVEVELLAKYLERFQLKSNS